MKEMPPITELVPHRGAMLLIERLVSVSPDHALAEAKTGGDHVFFREGQGIPAYVGLEMMAQTVCAWDGYWRRQNKQGPAIGFLLGCRRYSTARPYFLEQETLCVEAIPMLADSEMGSFRCRIHTPDGQELASGMISAYRPAHSTGK